MLSMEGASRQYLMITNANSINLCQLNTETVQLSQYTISLLTITGEVVEMLKIHSKTIF